MRSTGAEAMERAPSASEDAIAEGPLCYHRCMLDLARIETRYAKSSELNIAYQVFGLGGCSTR
jgi:hypothetical protein